MKHAKNVSKNVKGQNIKPGSGYKEKFPTFSRYKIIKKKFKSLLRPFSKIPIIKQDTQHFFSFYSIFIASSYVGGRDSILCKDPKICTEL